MIKSTAKKQDMLKIYKEEILPYADMAYVMHDMFRKHKRILSRDFEKMFRKHYGRPYPRMSEAWIEGILEFNHVIRTDEFDLRFPMYFEKEMSRQEIAECLKQKNVFKALEWMWRFSDYEVKELCTKFSAEEFTSRVN